MHFGHCEEFVLVHVDEETNRIIKEEVLDPPPHEPGLYPRWLSEHGVNVIIAGGMGQRAQNLFIENGIKVIVGATSEYPKSLVSKYLSGNLVSGDNICGH